MALQVQAWINTRLLVSNNPSTETFCVDSLSEVHSGVFHTRTVTWKAWESFPHPMLRLGLHPTSRSYSYTCDYYPIPRGLLAPPASPHGGRKEVDGKKGIIPSETLNPSVILSLL